MTRIAPRFALCAALCSAQALRAEESAGIDWQLLYGGRSRDSMAFTDELPAPTGDRIHPEGYYQDASVTGAGGGGSSLSITPDYPANADNEVSTAVPGEH